MDAEFGCGQMWKKHGVIIETSHADAACQTQMERYYWRCSPNADGMLLIMLFTKHRWNATDHVARPTQMDAIDVKTKKL